MIDIASLMHECLPRLRRYARALVADKTLADDLVQDTLERAWQKRQQWQPEREMRAWLFGIMHNLHISQLRQGGLALVELDDVNSASLSPSATTSSDLTTRATQTDRLEVRDLHSALQRLPREQRAVLLLVSLEQMGYQEIADVLDIPLGTVMSRLSRGRERLRMLMEEAQSALAGTSATTSLPTLKVVK